MPTRPLTLALATLAAVLFTGCLSVDLGSLFQPPPLAERTLLPGAGFAPRKILLLDGSGVIKTESPGMLDVLPSLTPDRVAAQLRRAEDDDAVRAVILRLDSPGGSVAATDTIYEELRRWRTRTGRPIYALVTGLGCSGGYYLAMAADRVYAQPTAVVGSIGVIARFPNLRGLADKVGYDEAIIKSGQMKDMGHPLLTLTPAELAVLQDIVDSNYRRFLAVVAANRPAYADAAALAPVADGRVWAADKALELGMIDGLAYLPDVIEEVRAQVAPGAAVVAYTAGRSPDATIYHREEARGPLPGSIQVDLGAAGGMAQTGFYYLWLPGR